MVASISKQPNSKKYFLIYIYSQELKNKEENKHIINISYQAYKRLKC